MSLARIGTTEGGGLGQIQIGGEKMEEWQKKVLDNLKAQGLDSNEMFRRLYELYYNRKKHHRKKVHPSQSRML